MERGDPIAISGSTGMATRPRLHYDVWGPETDVNPISFLEEKP
jgi:murein DD-endopeptidase MepM/ murein hydrolase activator NlpD